MTELRHTLAPVGVAPAMGRGYSHVVSATGRLVAVSGQVAFDEAGGEVIAAGTPEQVAEVPGSYTAQFLRPLLEHKPAKTRAVAA